MKQFLTNLFALLNAEYNYAVLRNFAGLPDGNPSRDIDLLITRKDLTHLRKILPGFAEKHRCCILYTNEDNQFLTIVLMDAAHEIFQLDFQHNFAWMGIDLLDEELVLKERVFNGKVWHLPPWLTFLPKYLYSRILGAPYPEKYAAVRAAALADNEAAIEAHLKQMSGGRGGLAYWDKTGKWTLRRQAFAAALKQNFGRAWGRMTEFLWRYGLDLFRRRGLMVSFSGPDGCGKTTVIELLRERLAVNTPVLFHFRPSLLPNLGEVAHKAKVIKEVDRNFDQPHRGKKKGVLSSFIRLGYYCFDYSIGYAVKVLPLRQRKSIVFFDRYFTDVIVDSERSSIYLSPKFIMFFRFLLPRCQYNFLFRVDPERILSRKKELTLEDMNVIYTRLDYLAARDKRYHWIDNNGTPEEAVNQILDVLAEKNKTRVQHSRFFKINGGNGATFFFSAASFADWRKSLEFYQGVSPVAKVKKFLLTAAYPVFVRKAKWSAEMVAAELRNVLPAGTSFSVGVHDSAMISPTRDKVILHHHGHSYEKFAFGKSRAGVARELALYRQLQNHPPQHFVASQLLGEGQTGEVVRFQMAYTAPQGTADEIPLAAYAEFFNLQREPDAPWAAMWKTLSLPFELANSDKEGTTPVGLVHHDFKPWNVKPGRIPQFFDFESVAPGLPLEDFFNYAVDPALHFGSAKECMQTLRERGMFDAARQLLTLLGIAPEEMERYWRWYLARRYDFFTKAGNPELAEKFLALYRLPIEPKEMRWKAVASVAGIMMAALALRLYYAAMHPIQSRDATGYLSLIQQWFENANQVPLGQPPLFCYLARALMFCGLGAEPAALTVNIAAGVLTVIPLYLAGCAIWKRHSAGLMAAALGAVMPRLVKFSCVALRDGLYLCFAAWSIAFWTMTLRAGSDKKRMQYAWSFLCGMAVAAGCMCRYEMALFLPFGAITLLVMALCRKQWRAAFCTPLVLLMGFAAGLWLLETLPGMPDIVSIYLNRIRVQFWSWKIWGMR